MPRGFRFSHFSIRVLAMVLGLLAAALGATYILVSRSNLAIAHEHAQDNLDLAVRVFDEATQQAIESLARSAGVMSGDDSFKQVMRGANEATISSALESWTRRVKAPVIALFGTDYALLGNSDPHMVNENIGPFQYLIRTASDEDKEQANGLSYFKDELHVLVTAPLYAPHPVIAGWFGLAFPINQAFAEKIKATSRVELTFISTEDRANPRVLASTLSKASAAIVARAAADDVRSRDLDLPDGAYVTRFVTKPMLGEAPIAVALQRPLAMELNGASELQNTILLVSLGALAIATLVALGIARSVSGPVRTLAAHTQHVAAGDYARRVVLDRGDELGELATAFNHMSAGLAERDRVRDLLDKNVSPEVAAQLLRDGASLGGEERIVTILFADLRGFTTLSEKLEPHALLTLLNRYLDRMSAEIERHGGVIDKFIGDAIMALFGAPVAQTDAPARAVAAALAMEAALADLNHELAAEGRPPLAIGVGINTARVVAGNIGSHRRLNYSVLGDGVNVAARLQSETRKAEHRTNLIASAATVQAAGASVGQFRPLGPVLVKGRAEPIEIFAIEAAPARR